MDQRYESNGPAAVPNLPPESGQNPERLHALDAVRGFALLLGIVFHSTMSFLNSSGQGWLIVDKDPSTTLSVVFYVLHMFRMATFFFIAGFFAHLLFHRRGQRAFVRDRLRRIGLPLVVGWPFLFASIVGCAIWGAWVMNGGTLPAEPPPDPNPPPLAFPLTHLWFLYVLLWLYALTLLARAIVERFDGAGRGRARLDRIVSGIVRSPFGVVDTRRAHLHCADDAVGMAAVAWNSDAGHDAAAEHRRADRFRQCVRHRLVDASAGSTAECARGSLAAEPDDRGGCDRCLSRARRRDPRASTSPAGICRPSPMQRVMRWRSGAGASG